MPKLFALLGVLTLFFCSSIKSVEARPANQSSSSNEYIERVYNAVKQYLPPKSGAFGEVRCKVSFRQNRSGYVQEIKISQCSDGTVSNILIRAVANASPIPQPKRPEDFREEINIIYTPQR